MWCSAANTHPKLPDHIVSGASFLTGGVFDCDLDHRQSVADLCLLYLIRRNPMHPLHGAITVLHVPMLVILSAVIAHRYTYGCLARYRTSQYHRTFIAPTVSLWNDLGDSVFDGVGLAGFKSMANVFSSA